MALRQTTVLPAGTGALRATFRAFGLRASHGRDDEGLRVLRVSPDAFEIEYDAPAGEVRPFDERRAEIRGAFLRACASLSGMGYALRIVVSPRRLVAYVDASELRPESQAASSRG